MDLWQRVGQLSHDLRLPHAARKRAAQQRLDRLEEACLEMEQMQERHAKRNKSKSEKDKTSQPRASMTDPEARRMKMGDNGFRPAMNVQFANDADAMVIIKTDVSSEGTQFYGRLYNEKKILAGGKDPYAAKPRENKHFTAFRERMGTEEAQAIYRRRAPAAEFPNAVCRNQGLTQFSVRGLVKAKDKCCGMRCLIISVDS